MTRTAVAVRKAACAVLTVLIAALAHPQLGAADQVSLVAWTEGPTPPLSLTTLDGRSDALAEHRGKAVVINFWATWCPPCRDELPSLDRLSEALRGLPVDVLTVNVGEGENRIKQFLSTTPVHLPVLLDRNADAQRAWKVRGLPATFVLNADGDIRYWYLGELDWTQPNILQTIKSVLPPAR